VAVNPGPGPEPDTGDAEAMSVGPGSLIRSRQYRVLLVPAAIVGVFVSLESSGPLALVHEIQVGI
jgi:hypothetical protein